jgi:hypothetical protein
MTDTSLTTESPPPQPAPAKVRRLGLDGLAKIAEIVGGLAVVISLIFVGVQLAQANKLERNAAMQRQIEAVINLQRSVMDKPDLLSAIGRASRGEPLTPIERVNVDAYVMYSDHTWEGLYLQYLDGQIDKDLWEADRAQAQLVNNNPVFMAVWEARRMWFTPRYRAFRDAELANGTGELMNWDYFKALEKPQPAAPAPAAPKPAAAAETKAPKK